MKKYLGIIIGLLFFAQLFDNNKVVIFASENLFYKKKQRKILIGISLFHF